MKNIIRTSALVALLFCLTSYSFGQTCSREGDFNAGSVKGSVTIKTNKKGKLKLITSGDFESNQGPDLNIYLSNSYRVTKESSVKLCRLEANTGQQKYAIPEEIDISEYKYVIIHCTEHNHHFGTAELNEQDGDGCVVTTDN